MRAIIYGVQNLDFTTADGAVIKGKSIYCGFENRYVDGLKTNKFFVSAENPACKDLKPDVEIEMSFDYNGRIDNIEIYND